MHRTIFLAQLDQTSAVFSKRPTHCVWSAIMESRVVNPKSVDEGVVVWSHGGDRSPFPEPIEEYFINVY